MRTLIASLSDIIEALDRIREVVDRIDLNAFERSWEKRWLVERGLEIISEASRRLPVDTKERAPDVPWTKIAGIGNILRHEYHRVAADVLWKLIRHDLTDLETAVRRELATAEDSGDRTAPSDDESVIHTTIESATARRGSIARAPWRRAGCAR